MESDKKPQNQTTHHSHQELEQEEEHFDPHEVHTLLSWSAPGRPYSPKSSQYFINIALLVLVISAILFLFKEFLLIMVVMSVAFLAYALATVAPKPFHYKISTEGVMVEDHFFLWQELYDFYFKSREGLDILHIRTHSFFPGELVIVLGDIHKEQIKSVLLPFLPFREYVKPTFMEKSGTWLEKNFPLDKIK